MKNLFVTKEENRAAKKAFTLVELLITIVVAALVLNGVLMSLVNSMVLNEYNQGFTLAMNFAKTQMENILSQSSNLATIVSVPGEGDPDKARKQVLTVAANSINGLYRIDVTDIGAAAGLAANELKNVKIAVCWKARGNRIIGDCKVGSTGALEWKSPYSSPCVLETAIAAH